MATIEIKVPDIGDFQDVAVIEVLVKPGDNIAQEQSLITVESDKASMEIPSTHAGILKTLKVQLGDKVNMGDALAELQTNDNNDNNGDTENVTKTESEVEEPPQAKTSSPASTPPVAFANTPPSVAPDSAVSLPSAPLPVAHEPMQEALGSSLPHASPSVRQLARVLGIPLAEVQGSGLKGRITHEDLHTFNRAVMSGNLQTKAQSALRPATGAAGGMDLLPWPKVDFGKFGPTERKPLSRIQKISAQNLTRNWVMIPAVTLHEDADITDLEAFRVLLNKENEKNASGVKLTLLAFLIKASVKALQQFPAFNSSLDGDELVLKQYYNIAFAADTPNGLVVPVVKNVDQKSVMEIAAESAALAKKAREGKLSPGDMQGACFTISSLGGIGGTGFSPIINAPEVAILGVNKSAMKPLWDGKQFSPRLILPMSLTADHRVIDGALATRFNVYLAQLLADFRRVAL